MMICTSFVCALVFFVCDSVFFSCVSFLYTHLEYFPLIQSRCHNLGGYPVILNDQLKIQYDSFLDRLCIGSRGLMMDGSMEDLLEAMYYFLIQNRISNAMRLMQVVKEKRLVHHDKNESLDHWIEYFEIYLAFFVAEDDQSVRELTRKLKIFQMNLSPLMCARMFGRDALLDSVDGDDATIDDESLDKVDHHGVMIVDAVYDEESKNMLVTLKNVHQLLVEFYVCV